MGSLLLIIPGLFALLEKVIGPLLTSGSASSIASGIMGLKSGGVSGIMGVIQGVFGQLESEKIAEIEAGVKVLVAQLEQANNDSNSTSIFGHWHSMFCWFTSAILVIHMAHAELLNGLIAWHFANVGQLAPLDTATLAIALTILGGSMGGKLIENVNANRDQSQDDDQSQNDNQSQDD